MSGGILFGPWVGIITGVVSDVHRFLIDIGGITSILRLTYSGIEVTDCFEDGVDVLKFLQQNETDAIFLDINIHSLDGIFVASNIAKFAKKPFAELVYN
ncbi:Transcriptional regulatory protein YpdB [compost metagenome]